MAKRIILFLALLFACSSASAAPTKELTVPFTVVQGVPVVTLRVNGGERRMILDSGASTTILRSPDLGGQRVTIQSATGRTMNATKCTATVETGDETMYLQATCGVNVPAGQDGLLGEDFLASFSSVSVDYRAKIVTLRSR